MAIDPISYAPTTAPSEFDFSPLARLAEQQAQARQAQTLASLASRYGAPSAEPSTSGAPTTSSVASGTDPYGRAISRIESGGRYDLLGPVTKTGDRAYGKYQVMGANIPVWTKAALGTELTPQAYLASQDAQEAVFKHRFGQYVQKYGAEGAAKAWFAGERGMRNPNARDQLGTSVSEYARRFMSGLEGG